MWVIIWGAGCLTWCMPVWDSSRGCKQISHGCQNPVLKDQSTDRFSYPIIGKLFRFGLAGGHKTWRDSVLENWVFDNSEKKWQRLGESRWGALLNTHPRPQLICWPWVNLCTLHSPLMMLYLFPVITVRAFMDDNVLHRRGMTTLWQCLFAGRLALESRQRNNNKDPLLSYPTWHHHWWFSPHQSPVLTYTSHLCVNHCRYWRAEGATPPPPPSATEGDETSSNDGDGGGIHHGEFHKSYCEVPQSAGQVRPKGSSARRCKHRSAKGERALEKTQSPRR